MKFTEAFVAGLPEGADHFQWDDSLPGFGARVRGKSKRWVIQYRIGSQQRRESLGDTRKVTLEDARRIARKRFAQVELGIDPVAEREAIHAKAAVARMTLGLAADRYLDAKRDMLRPSSFEAAMRYLTVHWAPLRGRPLAGEGAITRADIASRLQELIKQHGRTSAARARNNLASVFNWASREGIYEGANLASATNDPGAGLQSRDRVLDDREIAVLWRSCGDGTFGRILKLLLLTGCRRREIANLHRDEVNLDTGELRISGSRTKNGRELQLTLPPLALEILRSVPRRADSDYVFGKFSAFSYSMMALRARIIETEGASIPEFRLHDLRRSFRSGLARLAVAPHVAELAIGHVRGGVEGVYDRHRYSREIKAALALWAAHVEAVVTEGESKVVALRQA
jgi:integrase